MKKMMIALTMMLLTAATGMAMSYDQARNEALFLTDKMAYELNLTDAQYEAAYEINLDYLMGVTSRDDVFGVYWERRNLDLSYILFDWQWNAFRAATYFFRPLYWLDGLWHFAIYGRYPHRDYFYFGRPAFYVTYRGGHAWHAVGGHGYYHSHRDHFRPAHTSRRSHFGMLDRWNRGDFNHGQRLTTHHRPNNATHHDKLNNSSTNSMVHNPNRHHSEHANSSSTRENRVLTHENRNITHENRTLTRVNPSNRVESPSTTSGGSLSRSNNNGGSLGRSHGSGSFSRTSSSHGSGSFTRSSSSHSSGSLSRSSSGAGRSSGGNHHYGGRR